MVLNGHSLIAGYWGPKSCELQNGNSSSCHRMSQWEYLAREGSEPPP